VEKELEDSFDYNGTIDSLKQKIKNYNEITRYNNNIKEQINNSKNKIEISIKLQEQYNNIKEPQKVDEPIEYDKLKYDFLIKEVIIYEQKLQEKERITKYNESIEKEKQEDNQRIKSLISSIDLISYKVSILKETRQVLDKDFSAWLIDKGADYLKEKMNAFFQQVSSKYIITFSQDKNSIDFYFGDEDNVSPCSMASGMERAILAISFRVALCSLNNLNFMILDEIDSEFSEENSLKLYTTLLDVMNGSQIFCITHCEETQGFLINQTGSKAFTIVAGEVK